MNATHPHPRSAPSELTAASAGSRDLTIRRPRGYVPGRPTGGP